MSSFKISRSSLRKKKLHEGSAYSRHVLATFPSACIACITSIVVTFEIMDICIGSCSFLILFPAYHLQNFWKRPEPLDKLVRPSRILCNLSSKIATKFFSLTRGSRVNFKRSSFLSQETLASMTFHLSRDLKLFVRRLKKEKKRKCKYLWDFFIWSLFDGLMFLWNELYYNRASVIRIRLRRHYSRQFLKR